jgi:hypothetical protein
MKFSFATFSNLVVFNRAQRDSCSNEMNQEIVLTASVPAELGRRPGSRFLKKSLLGVEKIEVVRAVETIPVSLVSE